MNRHDRRKWASEMPSSYQAMVVEALRKGGLTVELASDVFTGWNMLVEMRKSEAGRELIKQAIALQTKATVEAI